MSYLIKKFEKIKINFFHTNLNIVINPKLIQNISKGN